jgi:hypothetical protein
MLSSIDEDWSKWPPACWTFRKAISIWVTCKGILERIVLQAGIGNADVYQRWDRTVLVPESGCFRCLHTFDTLPSLSSLNDSLLMTFLSVHVRLLLVLLSVILLLS